MCYITGVINPVKKRGLRRDLRRPQLDLFFLKKINSFSLCNQNLTPSNVKFSIDHGIELKDIMPYHAMPRHRIGKELQRSCKGAAKFTFNQLKFNFLPDFGSRGKIETIFKQCREKK